MAKASKLDQLSDQVITALLEKHACPLPFHAVRALFMGNIATPDMTASPIQAIRDLWGGELPEFDTKQDAEIFMMSLMQGLWNGLSAYQNRTNPFKLTRVKSHQSSWEVLARLSLLRREEIDGFIEGLFAGHEEIDLPEKAHRATNMLGQLRVMLVGLHGLATKNNTTPKDIKELDGMIKQVSELSIIAEKEMNVAILSCKRARAQMLETYVAEKPVLH
jgi:hypothetical protein